MIPTDLLKRLKPLYGSLADALWLEYQTGDEQTRRELEGLIAILAYRELGLGIGEERLLLEPPDADIIGDGEYEIGNVIYPGTTAIPFHVKRHELLRHVFVLGPSGTGKSTLLLGLLLRLLADSKPFMVFDFKRNYRVLLHNKHGNDVLVFTVGRSVAPFPFNALAPPGGVDFGEWAEALADACGAAYLLLQGARNVLKDALLRAHKEYGATATLRRAYHLIETELKSCRAGSRRYGWLESTSRTLQELSDGQFGAALNNAPGITLDTLLSRPVVMELEGLGEDQKRFFCLLMLQAILLFRKHDQAAREQLQHVLVFDESHNIFPKEQYGQLSVPSRLAREVREYGEAIIAATQQSDVADSLIANSGIKIFLRCDFPRDVDLASKLLQIDPKWLPKLPMGFAIARLPTRHYTPFLFHFSEQPLKNERVSDDAVRARWTLLKLTGETTTEPTNTAANTLSVQEQALLEDIAKYPISKITERYQRLRWNAYTGNRTKDALITKKLAFFDPVSTPTGRIKILSLTPAGQTCLATEFTRGYRRGGAAHEYWRAQLRSILEQHEYAVEEEYKIGNGETVDLHATKDGQHIFVEIETGKSDMQHNEKKCVQLPGRIIFFFTDSGVGSHYNRRALGTEIITAADLEQFATSLI